MNNLRPKSWFVELHAKYPKDFVDFMEVYASKAEFEWGIVDRGGLTVFDAAHLYLAVRDAKPEVVVELGSANGFVTAIMACALKHAGHEFHIYSFEEHPGPRISGHERSEAWDYKNWLTLWDYNTLDTYNLPPIDFVCVLEKKHLSKVEAKIKDGGCIYYNYTKETDLVYSKVVDYMMPKPNVHRDLILGGWHAILPHWNYPQMGQQIYKTPVSMIEFK